MMKLNKFSLFVYLICALLVSTLLQTKLPFNLNRMIGFGLFFLILYYIINIKRKPVFYILSLSSISVASSFMMTSDISTNLSNSIYWLIAIWLIVISDDAVFQEKLLSAFIRERRFVNSTIFIADIILIGSLFSAQGYRVTHFERYFVGFTVHQHTLASAGCFVMSLILTDLWTNSKARRVKFPIKHFILMLPPIIAVLQSSARIFLIPAGILVMYIYLYKIEDVSLKALFLPIGVVAVGYLFMNSNVFERMVNISGSDSNAYTSGRIVFWAADLNAFFQSDLIHKIFGHGFEFVTKINKELTSVAIGAHNDYITLLLGLGIFGTVVHLWVFIKEIKSTFKIKSIVKVVMLFAFWFIPSFMNGFYGYQMLLYSYVILKLLVFSESGVIPNRGSIVIADYREAENI